ncbi:hypothetical protein ACO2Q1_12550 [Brevundimonas sp. VNH65]|uniref:hypothetical protein n=1 Tax=Brevundimonas sp. VNH65 TaxID=3400917 RepID=UPI003C082A23
MSGDGKGKARDLSLWAIFALPLVVAAASLIGLVGALLDDGAWDGIGALLLAAPVAVTVWALIRRRA